jgi:hypothetical protein
LNKNSCCCWPAQALRQKESKVKFRIKPMQRNNEECEGIMKGTYHGVLLFSH